MPTEVGDSRIQVRAILIGAGILWILAIGFGYQKVLAYSLTPGAPAAAPETWPAANRHARNAHGPTIVMLAHPHCPCTRASLTHLNEIMQRFPQARGYVFFLQPAGFDRKWIETAAWTSARRIPRIVTVIDAEGKDAALFGARTSGQVVVYDQAGRLTFSGGITPSRGHVGENAGESRIAELFSGRSTDEHESLVYGCSLSDPDRTPASSRRSVEQ